MKSVKIFEKLTEDVKPVMSFDEFGLLVYHPNYMPKKLSLVIYDIQEEIRDLNQKIYSITKEISELDFSDIESFEKKKELATQVKNLEDEVYKSVTHYVECLCKLPQGSLISKLESVLDQKEEIEEYPIETLVYYLQSEINQGIRDYNLEKAGLTEKDLKTNEEVGK